MINKSLGKIPVDIKRDNSHNKIIEPYQSYLKMRKKMGRRKKGKNNFLDMGEQAKNLPTLERISKGGMRIRNNIGVEDDPLRIDKLLRNGIIDEMQHLYGMQIITYWMV